MTTVELFTTPDCTRCPQALELLEALEAEHGFDLEVTDAVENRGRALKYGVLAAPTVVIDGETTITGVPTREEIVSHLDG